MGELPRIDLTTFFLSISSAAFMGLGYQQPESGGEPAQDLGRVDLDLARQNIDLLELMQDKTRGNRSSEEEALLQQLLFEMRLRFVEVQKKVSARR